VLGSSCTRVRPAVNLSPSSLAALPGTSIETTVSVTDGSEARCPKESYQLAVALPAGFSGTFAEPTLLLSPGTTQSTTLTVTVPASALPGDVTLATSATGLQSGVSGSTSADLSVESEVCTRAAPTVTLAPAAATIGAGGTAVTVATITNNSSLACGAEGFSVRVAKPTGWSRTMSPASLTIEPGESAQSTVTLTSPLTQPAGTATIKIRGRSTATGLSGLALFGVETR
jgi:uncharacterized membrane protein